MNQDKEQDLDITDFTILGERCSGNHFLQYALTSNFKLKYNRFEVERYLPKKNL